MFKLAVAFTLQQRAEQLAKSKELLLNDIVKKKDMNRKLMDQIADDLANLDQLHGKVLTT